MSLAADALQPLLVRELVELSGRAPHTRLADVITDGPGAGYDLDFNAADSSIRIDFREPHFIANAIAGDSSRFAAACFTSLNSIVESVENPQTLAWAFVRLYYAAFYGGHGLIRLLGRSCTQLEGRHVSKIRSLGLALNNTPPFAVGAGLYYCTINSGQTGLTMIHARGGSGGSHEIFVSAHPLIRRASAPSAV